MASEMQKKVLNQLRKITTEHGKEFVLKPDWDNTGHAYIQEDGKFITHYWLKYSFQTGYCSIEIYRGQEDGMKKRLAGNGYLLYNDDTNMNAMFGQFENLLKEAKST